MGSVAERIAASGYDQAEVCRAAIYHPIAFARGLAGERGVLLEDFEQRIETALARLKDADEAARETWRGALFRGELPGEAEWRAERTRSLMLLDCQRRDSLSYMRRFSTDGE